MRNRKLFKFAQVSALCGVFAMPWIGPLTMTLQARANDGPIHIDSDDPRYELGYDFYELGETVDGRYHVDVTGLGDHWGEITIDTDSESWMSFDVTTENQGAAFVVVDLFDNVTDVPFAHVRVDGELAAVAVAEEDEFIALYITEGYVPVDASPALQMLSDIMRDENFRDEFGSHEPIDGGDPRDAVGAYGAAGSVYYKWYEAPDPPDPPDFDDDFYDWWESFWGVEYEHTMTMIKDADDDSVVLKQYDEDYEDSVQLASADLEKHYVFWDLGYTSDELDLQLTGFVDWWDDAPAVEFTYSATLQVTSEYWAAILHGPDDQIAPLVLSVTTFTLDQQGPSPYDGIQTATHVFPMLEFAMQSEFLDYIELEAALSGTSTISSDPPPNCYDEPDQPLGICVLACADLNQCVAKHRHERNVAMAKCHLDIDYIFSGAMSGGILGVAIGLPLGMTAGTVVLPGVGTVLIGGAGAVGGGLKGGYIGGSIGNGQMWLNYWQCKRIAKGVYRVEVCNCYATKPCGPGLVPPPDFCPFNP